MDEFNKKIVEEAMKDHDKHYRCLVRWIERRLKRKPCPWNSGPHALTELLGEGYTVASSIWEKYSHMVIVHEIYYDTDTKQLSSIPTEEE